MTRRPGLPWTIPVLSLVSHVPADFLSPIVFSWFYARSVWGVPFFFFFPLLFFYQLRMLGSHKGDSSAIRLKLIVLGPCVSQSYSCHDSPVCSLMVIGPKKPHGTGHLKKTLLVTQGNFHDSCSEFCERISANHSVLKRSTPSRNTQGLKDNVRACVVHLFCLCTC